jgi:hypothetical protein
MHKDGNCESHLPSQGNSGREMSTQSPRPGCRDAGGCRPNPDSRPARPDRLAWTKMRRRCSPRRGGGLQTCRASAMSLQHPPCNTHSATYATICRCMVMHKDGDLEAADDPRQLRAGDVDPNPKGSSARPGPIDMDENQKEMRAEERTQLACMHGKALSPRRVPWK